MPTTITVAAFQTALAACGDAIEADDWTLATKKYAVAETINAGLALDSSAAGTHIVRRDSLRGLKAAIDAAQTAADRADGIRLVHLQTGFG
jgi:hypothetical protein